MMVVGVVGTAVCGLRSMVLTVDKAGKDEKTNTGYHCSSWILCFGRCVPVSGGCKWGMFVTYFAGVAWIPQPYKYRLHSSTTDDVTV